MLNRLLRSFWIMYCLKGFRWYRRWYGGRWEYHFIDVCCCSMWLDMDSDRCWPKYRQPCSVGVPVIEHYPTNGRSRWLR